MSTVSVRLLQDSDQNEEIISRIYVFTPPLPHPTLYQFLQTTL